MNEPPIFLFEELESPLNFCLAELQKKTHLCSSSVRWRSGGQLARQPWSITNFQSLVKWNRSYWNRWVSVDGGVQLVLEPGALRESSWATGLLAEVALRGRVLVSLQARLNSESAWSCYRLVYKVVIVFDLWYVRVFSLALLWVAGTMHAVLWRCFRGTFSCMLLLGPWLMSIHALQVELLNDH